MMPQTGINQSALNSSVEAVEKPPLGKSIARHIKSDLAERSTIDAQPVGKGSSTP
jgi:hypothetical protein